MSATWCLSRIPATNPNLVFEFYLFQQKPLQLEHQSMLETHNGRFGFSYPIPICFYISSNSRVQCEGKKEITRHIYRRQQQLTSVPAISRLCTINPGITSALSLQNGQYRANETWKAHRCIIVYPCTTKCNHINNPQKNLWVRTMFWCSASHEPRTMPWCRASHTRGRNDYLP